MRTESINIYKFDELPTEEAKENARNWWRKCEENDPAWYGEHMDSMKAALHAFRTMSTADAIDAADNMKLTGYCADAILADVLKEYPGATTERILAAYGDAWRSEMDSRMQADYVDGLDKEDTDEYKELVEQLKEAEQALADYDEQEEEDE